MEINVAQPVRFKKIFDVLKEIYDDIEIKFSPSGFGFLLSDKANVVLVQLSVPNAKNNFPIYVCNDPVTVCFKLATFCDFLKPLDNDYDLTLKIADDDIENPTALHIRLQGEPTKVKYEGIIKLNIPMQVPPDFDEVTFEKTAQLSSSNLRSYINNLSWVHDMILISIGDDKISLRCVGEQADVELCIPCVLQTNCNTINVKDGENLSTALPPSEEAAAAEPAPAFEGIVSGVFRIKFLKTFLKAQELASTVLLSLSNNGPLMMRFKMTDPDYGLLSFFVGPVTRDQSPFKETEDIDNNLLV